MSRARDKMTTEKALSDLATIKAMVNRHFDHYKGGSYTVIQPVWNATEDRWEVGYRSLTVSDDTLYTRTVEDFMSDVTIARFREI